MVSRPTLNIFSLWLHWSIATAAGGNKAWVLVKHPEMKYDPQESFVLKDVDPLPPLQDGQYRVKNVMTSTMPSIRGAMGERPLGQVFEIEQILKVMESRNARHPVGEYLWTSQPLQKEFIMNEQAFAATVAVNETTPAQKYLSILSMSAGLTAWHVVENVGTGKVSTPCTDTVLITSAASATGMVAGQLYKLKGCKVIGITSTQEKVARLMKLGGFDAVISYKTEDLDKRLRELAPEGIDLDFENVGGPMLDTIMNHMKMYGRIIICGMIHDYEKPFPTNHGIKNAMQMIGKRLKLEGIHVTDLFPEKVWWAFESMKHLVLQGKLQSDETIIHGFEKWPEAMRMMLDAQNFGRLIVANDDDDVRQEL